MASTDERDPCEDFLHLRKELSDYDPILSQKPFIVVGNKKDEDRAEENIQLFKKRFPDLSILPLSAVLEDGLEDLKSIL